MADKDPYECELAWELMTGMEQAVWGTIFALNLNASDGGLGAADQAIVKLRSLTEVRSCRLEPEYEAAKANVAMDFDEFAVWYRVECRIRYPGRKPPTREAASEAYERFSLGLNDFY